MTWSVDPNKNRAFNGGEVAKIRWEALGWCQGVGLDLGCGRWKLSSHVIGVDGGGAKHGGNINGDVSDLGIFAAGALDFVFSSHCLEDLADDRAALAEWWRVLKVGGRLVLYLPHKGFYPNIGTQHANPKHKHDFLPEDIVRAMQAVAPDWALVENQERDAGDEYSFFQVYVKRAAGLGQGAALEESDPAKRAIVIRFGGFGDVLVAGSTFPHLKAEGWHLTVITGDKGKEILKADPHVDRVIACNAGQMSAGELRELRAYWHDRCARFIDFTESFEGLFLANPLRPNWYWRRSMRRRFLGGNYLEGAHEVAGVPQEYRQRFYATEAEQRDARAWRAGMRQVVVLSASGSGVNKIWPHMFEYAWRLVERNADVHLVVLGDLQGGSFVERANLHVIGQTWSMRRACAFAQAADLVIGEETGLLNAVAFDAMPKIVLLSHSGPTQLTRDWVNTTALTGDVPCYPCHRLHADWTGCRKDPDTQLAACQAAIKPMTAVELTERVLGNRADERVRAAA